MGYSRKTDPVTTDLSVIWDSENSEYKLTPLSAVQTLFEENDSTTNLEEPNTQYASPATGTTVALTDANEDNHLILTPTGTLAALTLTLPATLRDKQTVLVNCTQIITTLTVDGNGATVNGAPTTLAANGYFKLKYDISLDSWYRVG